MFTKIELAMILNALVAATKSCQRLANREGQPDAVQSEYRKAEAELVTLRAKVVLEIGKVK